ncbi:hypothetical protein V6N13_110984 [Hibiscus sabdariffa]
MVEALVTCSLFYTRRRNREGIRNAGIRALGQKVSPSVNLVDTTTGCRVKRGFIVDKSNTDVGQIVKRTRLGEDLQDDGVNTCTTSTITELAEADGQPRREP